MRMNLLGVLPFTAPYLAWVLLTLSALLGSPLEADLVRGMSGRARPRRVCRTRSLPCGLVRLVYGCLAAEF